MNKSAAVRCCNKCFDIVDAQRQAQAHILMLIVNLLTKLAPAAAAAATKLSASKPAPQPSALAAQ
jgi:hypothetical protein